MALQPLFIRGWKQLSAYERIELTQNVNPYVYPWITFTITLLLSLILTVITKKNKIGSQLL